MVERVNGTIKIKQYKNKNEMQIGLLKFLIYYIFYRKHGTLKREMKVKTPFGAIEKWFELNPEIFKENPLQFKNKVFFCKNLLQVVVNNPVKLDNF